MVLPQAALLAYSAAMLGRSCAVFASILWLCAASALSPGSARAQASTAVGNLNTEDDSSRLAWRGTALAFSQSLNMNAFSKSAQASYNPTYSWTFILLPRWYFSKTTFLNIDQRLYLELTDSDSTLYSQRAMLSDTVVGVDTVFLDEALQGDSELTLAGGLHVIAPTSISSRADTMVIGGRARASATMAWKKALKGASLTFQGRYSHRFLRHNSLEVEQPYPCLTGGVNVGSCEFVGSMSGVRNSLSSIISGSLQLTDTISLEALVWLSWSRGSDLAPYNREIETGVIRLEDGSTTHWRNERYLVLGADWQATDWLSVGVSIIDYFPEKAPDGSNRGLVNPLDLMVGLTTSIAFDRLYLTALGRRKQPVVTAQLGK
jgi:hypothetical protein